jgi:hypothetical protein
MARRVANQKKKVEESLVVESLPVEDLKAQKPFNPIGFRCSKCGQLHTSVPKVLVYSGVSGSRSVDGSCACGSLNFKEEYDA